MLVLLWFINDIARSGGLCAIQEYIVFIILAHLIFCDYHTDKIILILDL